MDENKEIDPNNNGRMPLVGSGLQYAPLKQSEILINQACEFYNEQAKNAGQGGFNMHWEEVDEGDEWGIIIFNNDDIIYAAKHLKSVGRPMIYGIVVRDLMMMGLARAYQVNVLEKD